MNMTNLVLMIFYELQTMCETVSDLILFISNLIKSKVDNDNPILL